MFILLQDSEYYPYRPPMDVQSADALMSSFRRTNVLLAKTVKKMAKHNPNTSTLQIMTVVLQVRAIQLDLAGECTPVKTVNDVPH